MKKAVAFLIGVMSIGAAYAQGDYKSAIGGRLGTTYYDIISVSFKTFITKSGALELNGGFGTRSYAYDNATSVSGAVSYQHHFPIKSVDGLKWFIGGGVTIFDAFSEYEHYDGFGFGIFPTGGVDYKFPKIPLNVSADVRPTFHITSPDYYNSFYTNLGLSARYTFK